LFEVVGGVELETEILSNGGGISDLQIAAVYQIHRFGTGLGNIFALLVDRDVFHEVRIPGLFADMNGDGMLNDADVLYSFVDLDIYLNAIPIFSLGDSFAIINGVVAGLPGMMFSSTPFTTSGSVPGFFRIVGTPVSAVGTVHSQYGITVVIPEPGTWFLFATGCVGLLGYGWWGRQRTA
jgi:hypothetical protein